MIDLIFDCRVSDGNMNILKRSEMNEQVSMLPDGMYQLILKKKRVVRSIQMNRYYWAEVVPKVQQGLKQLGTKLSLSDTDKWLIGFMKTISKEQAHDFLKDKFLDEQVNKDTGEIISKRKTTTNMTNTEFIEYIDSVTQFAAEILGVQIYKPNEQAILI